jgi:hypothetical protein
VVILPEEHNYIARRAWLYCRKRGYIPGRPRLYSRKSAVILQKFCNENSGHLSANHWRTHFARTKIRLHTVNQLDRSSGSALKVSVGWCGGGGGFHLIMCSLSTLS